MHGRPKMFEGQSETDSRSNVVYGKRFHMATDNNRTNDNQGTEILLQGISVCPGIGISRVHRVDSVIDVPRTRIESDAVQSEQERYTHAVATARHQLQRHIAAAHEGSTMSSKAILDVHEAILADTYFHDRIRERIATNCKNAEWSLEEEAHKTIAEFDAMRDSYFQARGEDIRDMVGNILTILATPGTPESFSQSEISGDQVFVSQHLFPSSAVLAYRKHAAGFASASHALSSHAAILLKGFGIPTVAGVQNLQATAQEGDEIIVDGMNGLVIVRPSRHTLDRYRALKKETESPEEVTPATPCFTRDGTRVFLHANIENLDQIRLMLNRGFEGIGLFRTEFFILTSGQMPGETEQYETYRRLISKAAGRTVVIRTFDIGADKHIGLLQKCTGNNPSLGVRGIRRHLSGHTEELRIQLRAILRASIAGNVGVLIPMVTTLDDVIHTKKHFNTVRENLRREGLPFSEEVSFGAMIETPAAAIAVDSILQEVDFVSLGTNDLLQYLMAADRDNEQVLHYNEAGNGSFLWLLQFIIDKAIESGRQYDVTICGEIASQPDIIPQLLRFGYRSFSISPVAAAPVRNACAQTDLALEKP